MITNKSKILKKLNLDIRNSERIINNTHYFYLSKWERFLYNLLNFKDSYNVSIENFIIY